MKREKPIEIFGQHSGARIELVGYHQEKGWGKPYIRIETLDGIYLGCVKPRQLKRLQKWCRRCLAKRKVKK